MPDAVATAPPPPWSRLEAALLAGNGPAHQAARFPVARIAATFVRQMSVGSATHVAAVEGWWAGKLSTLISSVKSEGLCRLSYRPVSCGRIVYAPLVTGTSSLRSLPPFWVCSRTLPIPRT